MPGVCCGCSAPDRAQCNSKREERQSETCRAFVSVLVASLGSLTLGYAMGYPSSALIELADASKLRLPEDYAFAKGSPTSDLFGVSLNLHELLFPMPLISCLLKVTRIIAVKFWSCLHAFCMD